VIGLILANPEVGRKAIRLRQFWAGTLSAWSPVRVSIPHGQTPGGVRNLPPFLSQIDEIKARLPEAFEKTTEIALSILKDAYPSFEREV